jgi:hypothetical protein
MHESNGVEGIGLEGAVRRIGCKNERGMAGMPDKFCDLCGVLHTKLYDNRRFEARVGSPAHIDRMVAEIVVVRIGIKGEGKHEGGMDWKLMETFVLHIRSRVWLDSGFMVTCLRRAEAVEAAASR